MAEKDKAGIAVAAGIGGAALGALGTLTLRKEAKAPTDEEVKQALVTIYNHQVTTLEEIKTAIARIPVVEEVIMRIEQIPFIYNLAPLQGVRLEEVAPFDGYIKQVTIHWPDGCNALVGVKVGHGTPQFCPRDGYLALNDATPTYPFNVKVKEGDTIWVEMRNTDGVNPHNITVTVSIEGVAFS